MEDAQPLALSLTQGLEFRSDNDEEEGPVPKPRLGQHAVLGIEVDFQHQLFHITAGCLWQKKDPPNYILPSMTPSHRHCFSGVPERV